MSKTMTVDILSSIKGAQPSESVNQLFDVIKNAHPSNENATNNVNRNCVSVNDLREDVVVESSAIEKEIILENLSLTSLLVSLVIKLKTSSVVIPYAGFDL